jgi:hypothetical protein
MSTVVVFGGHRNDCRSAGCDRVQSSLPPRSGLHCHNSIWRTIPLNEDWKGSQRTSLWNGLRRAFWAPTFWLVATKNYWNASVAFRKQYHSYPCCQPDLETEPGRKGGAMHSSTADGCVLAKVARMELLSLEYR